MTQDESVCQIAQMVELSFHKNFSVPIALSRDCMLIQVIIIALVFALYNLLVTHLSFAMVTDFIHLHGGHVNHSSKTYFRTFEIIFSDATVTSQNQEANSQGGN